jgi:hypothetical protein
LKKKQNLESLVRSLHRDLGYFVIGLTLIYAITGIILSGRALGWLEKTYNADIIMSKNIEVQEFNSLFINTILEGEIASIFPEDSYESVKEHLKLKVLEEKENKKNEISFNAWRSLDVTYNKDTGVTNILYVGHPVVIKLFLDVHKSTHTKAWFYLAIIYSVILSFLALSSLLMLKGKYGFKRRGIYFMLGGFAVVALFLFLG